jgi:thiamine kinase-like enzyme
LSRFDSHSRIRALPLWQGEIAIEPLLGGISNECWLITDASGRHVVRLGEDYPFHHVFRERELMTAQAAELGGFAPKLEYGEPGVMVARYIEGARTYEAEDVRANVARIVPLLKGFHSDMPRHVHGPGFLFWPFHVIRDYARTLRQANSRMSSQLDGYVQLAEELEAAQIPLPIVFGHNDLLPANLLDDGARLWLIDFEYAGFSTAMFDLAGLSSNAGFSVEESDELLRLFFGREPDLPLRRSLAAMQCASLLREAMWSMVSELYLDAPGTDYVAYTQENIERLEGALEAYRSRFERSGT